MCCVSVLWGSQEFALVSSICFVRISLYVESTLRDMGPEIGNRSNIFRLPNYLGAYLKVW